MLDAGREVVAERAFEHEGRGLAAIRSITEKIGCSSNAPALGTGVGT